MNIFVPQSVQTQTELEELADVKRCVISQQSSKTIIGITFDGLCGNYMLTQPTTKIGWKDAMNMIAHTNVERFDEFKKEGEMSGQDLFSKILYKKINKKWSNGAQIKNGKMLSGPVGKNIMGSKQKDSLNQLIWDEYGVDGIKSFIDNAQHLADIFNLWKSFTVSFDDVLVKPEIMDMINKLYESKDLKIGHMITEHENNPSAIPDELFVQDIFGESDSIRNEIAKLVYNNAGGDNNNIVMMSDGHSGSKGSTLNYGQIVGCVGLQTLGGTYIEKKMNGRMLPYFCRDDDLPLARGLSKNSFTSGLTFKESVSHNMACREGLITAAVNTASSGYVQRKLIKNAEDAKVEYDGTVRTANHFILQFSYGDSGANTEKQYDYYVGMLEQGNKDLEKRHKFDETEMKEFSKKDFDAKDNDALFDTIKELRDNLRASQIKATLDFVTPPSSVKLPINLNRIVENAKNDTETKGDTLEPDYVIKNIEQVVYELTPLLCMTKKDRKNPKSVKNLDEKILKRALRTSLYDAISPKRCIVEYKLNKNVFDEIINEIIVTFEKNLVEPGEMVGVVAAQAVGEPLTQMTLKAFHQSGIASGNIASVGMPRIVELFGLTPNMKTPMMTIMLTDEFANNRQIAEKIASHIRTTTIKHVVNKVEAFYDPNPTDPNGYMKKDNVSEPFQPASTSTKGCQSDISNLPWLIRFELDREKLYEKEVTLLDIKSKFCHAWERKTETKSNKKEDKREILNKITQYAILSNSDNDIQPVLHIRFDMTDISMGAINDLIDVILNRFKIKGVVGVRDVQQPLERPIVTYNNKDEVMEKKKQFLIYTSGINTEDIKYIKGIDQNRTMCNDVHEVYRTLGVEAARSCLIRELFVAYDRSGNSINTQHLSIFADIMTGTGVLVSIDRNGINKTDTDPLSRASFERTVEQLITAATFGEVDHVRGVSSKIMLGAVIKGGTGLCDIILDDEMLENSEYVEDPNVKFKEINPNTIIQDVIGKKTTKKTFVPDED